MLVCTLFSNNMSCHFFVTYIFHLSTYELQPFIATGSLLCVNKRLILIFNVSHGFLEVCLVRGRVLGFFLFTFHEHLESRTEFYTVYLLSFIPFQPYGPIKPSRDILKPFCFVSPGVRIPLTNPFVHQWCGIYPQT